MSFKDILNQLDIPAQCKKCGLSLWQCPHFLFLVMGVVIIGSTFFSFFIGSRYIDDPQMVLLLTLLITAVLFILAVIITRSFETLAEANRMKSEFVSVVSHQLRSPLSNLIWAIELLMSGRTDSVTGKQLEYLEILKENSARMSELVSDLLIVSRIETAKIPFKKQEFFLEDLIKKLIQDFGPFARASNVEIKFGAEKDLPKVFSDPHQIRLAIENLLDNAIRYIKEKGQVEIKLKKQDENFYFEVKDAGVGIPQKDQKYIFQKFFRSENVMRYQTQGSSLGLYIAKAIIERAGGKIGFQSQEGVGSTFWFTLPMKPR